MAETMQFDLVSPERMLASLAASEVQVPGAEGDFTAMPGHAPFLSTLRPGLVRAKTAEGEKAFLVTGGFAEVTAEGVSLLAERGVPKDELDQAGFDALLADLKRAEAAAEGTAADEAGRMVAEISALARELGLNASN